MAKRVAPQAVADWISQVVDEVIQEKQVKVTDPKNLDVQSLCSSFPKQVPCFIEISKGSHNKYEWDVQHNIMILDRVLSSAVFYPYDYGFIPQTYCEDGDPLDIMVIGTNAVLPGVVAKARPLGYLDFEDVDKVKDPKTGAVTEKYVADQKVLAVLEDDPYFTTWKGIEDVPPKILDMVQEFFKNYKNLEKKSKLKPKVDKGWKDAKAAQKLIEETHVAFTKKIEAGLKERSN